MYRTDDEMLAVVYSRADAGRRRTRGRAVGAATAGALLVVGLVVVAGRSRVQHVIATTPTSTSTSTSSVEASTSSTTTPPSTTTATAAVRPTKSLFEAPPVPITWKTIRPDGTMSRSTVSGIAAGPNGFVAVGRGVNGSGAQSRVWFSPDGEHWTEPDEALFAPLGYPIGYPFAIAATSERYLLTAIGPNPGLDGLGDTSVFESLDGQSWHRLANPPNTVGILAAGDRFYAPNPYGMLTSTDGQQWLPTNVTDREVTRMYGEPGRYFAQGFTRPNDEAVGRPVLQQSFDGITFTPVAGETLYGSKVFTPSGVVATEAKPCFGHNVDGPWVLRDDCGPDHGYFRYDEQEDRWNKLAQIEPGPGFPFEFMLAYAHQLVRIAEGTDARLRVWTSTNAIDWTPAGVDVEMGTNRNPAMSGLPGYAVGPLGIVAVVEVTLSPGRDEGPHTMVVVGRHQSNPD
jgi:hypothetical protein